MQVFHTFQLGASPWPTSGHNSRIFPRLLWRFSASFILPLFNIPTFSSFHCYFDILIGWLMLLSAAQPLGPIRRSFQRYSDTSDILFIFISPLLYLNFGITQKIERDFSPLVYHCEYSATASPQYTATQILTSAQFRLCLSFHLLLNSRSFNLAPLSFPLPQATHRLDIAEGSVKPLPCTTKQIQCFCCWSPDLRGIVDVSPSVTAASSPLPADHGCQKQCIMADCD